MNQIRTRYPKLFLAGLVFGFYLVVASIRGWGTEPLDNLSNDAVILTVLKGGVLFAMLFTAGHFALRHVGVAKSWAYAALGAACALPLFVVNLASGTMQQLASTGNLSTRARPGIDESIVK